MNIFSRFFILKEEVNKLQHIIKKKIATLIEKLFILKKCG